MHRCTTSHRLLSAHSCSCWTYSSVPLMNSLNWSTDVAIWDRHRGSCQQREMEQELEHLMIRHEGGQTEGFTFNPMSERMRLRRPFSLSHIRLLKQFSIGAHISDLAWTHGP